MSSLGPEDVVPSSRCPQSLGPAPPARRPAPRTRHADALELPDLVQAGRVILTRVGDALVDVDLAAGAGVALRTLALEGAQRVDALARVLTGVGSWRGAGGRAAPVRVCFRHPGLWTVRGQARLPHQTGRPPSDGSPIRLETLGQQPHGCAPRRIPRPDAPSEHSSTSWLQAGPVYPEGQVQMALPFTGLVSQLEPSLQGLLMQASFKWQSRPGGVAAVSQAPPTPRLGMTSLPRPRHRAPCRAHNTQVTPGGSSPAGLPQHTPALFPPERPLSRHLWAPGAAICVSQRRCARQAGPGELRAGGALPLLPATPDGPAPHPCGRGDTRSRKRPRGRGRWRRGSRQRWRSRRCSRCSPRPSSR